MMMRPGDSWHRTNSACKAEILVEIASHRDGVNPRCRRGSAMKKKYSSAVFRYLHFLQVQDETVAEPVPCHQKRRLARRWQHSLGLHFVLTEKTRCLRMRDKC
jgi:hypothetical protein